MTRFRWASLQLQSLTELKTDADILLRLGKVPPNLEQLYLEIYQIIITNHGPVSQAIARHSFDLLLGAKDDFTIEMFLAFVTPDKSNPISVPELLDICCNLIVLDETLKIIRFAHTSVLEFFESLPEFVPAKMHSGISFACLELVGRWDASGRDVWSWNFNPMGRYVNKYLRYHLREAGSQERLGILLPQLVSFLGRDCRKNFVTLDDRSRKFWRVIRSPPEHVESTVAWVFNACAFGFHEIVEFVIESSLASDPQDLSRATEGSTHDSHRFSAGSPPSEVPVTFNRSQMKNNLTPATFTCLAFHALRSQSYVVLAMLIERHLCLLSNDLLLQPTCMCAHTLGKGPVYPLLHFHGLAHVNEGLIRLVVDDSRDIRGDGEYDPIADDPPLLVRDLISGGLQFHVTKDMLDNISPPSSTRWTYESWFLLLENDPKSEMSNIFIKAMVQMYPNDKRRLQILFRICQRNGISQGVFEELGTYCRYLNILDWMREVDFNLTITNTFLINVFVDNGNILRAIFERWKFIEEIMTQDVLTSLIYTARDPIVVQSVLQQYTHLIITPTVLNALFECWKDFSNQDIYHSPTLAEYLESREDFQESKNKLTDPGTKVRVHPPAVMASWFRKMSNTANPVKTKQAPEEKIQ